MSDLKRKKLKALVEELKNMRGRHTELVTIYVPAGFSLDKVMSQVKNEQSTAMNIKSKPVKKNVMSALERIIQHLKLYKRTPENGLAIFCGNVSDKEGVSDIEIWAVEPGEPIATKLYRCDQVFVLDPLESLLEEKELYGLIVIDKSEATIGLLKGKRIEMMKHKDSVVPGKTKKGGWSQSRYERIREGLLHDFMKQVGEIATEKFKPLALKGIIIGGPGPVKEMFAKGDFIAYNLKDKVIGIVDVSYSNEYGLREVVERSEDILSEASVMKEKKIFNSRREPKDFKITHVDEPNNKIRIKFRESKYQALPLHFWMFDRSIQHLQEKQGYTPLGTAVKPPYIKGSVEEAIWKKPFPTGSSEYKASSHICDILALMDIIEYGFARNPESNRRVQGARINTGPLSPPPRPNPPKEAFLKKYKTSILTWIQEHENEIIDARNNYRWKRKTTQECVNERNRISRAIINSRIKNQGAVELDTLDEVMAWGGFGKFPLRNPEKALKVTSKAFNLLDKGQLEKAVLTLMSVNGVGIARATKILGLSDQEALAIYDSRVGNALRTITYQGEKIIHVRPSRTGSRAGDFSVSNTTWAQDYQKLIWILEVMQEYLVSRGIHYRIADIEMALFIMGK